MTTPAAPSRVIDWDDPAAREELVDSRAKNAHAMSAILHGCQPAQPTAQAAQLPATVTGRDQDEGEDGVLRIAPPRGRLAAGRIAQTGPAWPSSA